MAPQSRIKLNGYYGLQYKLNTEKEHCFSTLQYAQEGKGPISTNHYINKYKVKARDFPSTLLLPSAWLLHSLCFDITDISWWSLFRSSLIFKNATKLHCDPSQHLLAASSLSFLTHLFLCSLTQKVYYFFGAQIGSVQKRSTHSNLYTTLFQFLTHMFHGL